MAKMSLLSKGLLAAGGAIGGVAGYGVSSVVNRPRPVDISINRMRAMQEYDRGDVWQNPDEVVAGKECKAFHDPKTFV